MADTLPPQANTHLIVSLALPFGAAMIMAALVLAVPVDPLAPDITFAFLGGAAVLGVLGPAVGKMLRGRIAEPKDFAAYLQQSLAPTIVSLAIREGGVILAAFYIHFGGVLFRGLAVAAVIVITMLLDVRTPARLKSEYDALVGHRA